MLPTAVADYQCKFVIINIGSLSYPQILTLNYNRDNMEVQAMVQRGVYLQYDYDPRKSMSGDFWIFVSSNQVHEYSTIVHFV